MEDYAILVINQHQFRTKGGANIAVKINLSNRQYLLIKYLEETSEIKALKEIGEGIGCSYKTVQNELKNLRKLLPNGWAIHSRQGSGVHLTQPTDETVDCVFTHDGNDVLFDLMERLLTDQSYSLEELCSSMYLTRKATLRFIASAETFVQSFFLTLQRRPYQIVGSEGGKRLLLYEMNVTKKGTLNHYDNTQLEPIKPYLEIHYGIHLTNYGFNAFSIFLAICLRRDEEGFHADELPYLFSSSVQEEPLFIAMQDLFNYLEELMEVTLPVHERIYLYLALIYTEFQFTIIHRSDRHDLLKAHRDYDEFMQFIHFLEDHLQITISSGDDLVFYIFNLYQVSKLRNVTPELQYLPQESILRSVKHNSKDLYHIVHHLCQEWSKQAGFIFNISNIISLVVLLNRHIENSNALNANILVLTSRSFFLGDYNGMLESHFEGKAAFQTMSTSRITHENDIPPETDLIITDALHEVDTFSLKVILITQVMMDKDFEDIGLAIKEVTEAKKERLFTQKKSLPKRQ